MDDYTKRAEELQRAWDDFDRNHSAALAELRKCSSTHEANQDYAQLRNAEERFRTDMRAALTSLNLRRRMCNAVPVQLF